MKGQLVLGKYRLLSYLGNGCFGEIWIAQSCFDRTYPQVAVKLELIDTTKEDKSTLVQEAIVYNSMRRGEKDIGLARFFGLGSVKGNRALVMELLGPNLDDIFRKMHRQFPVKLALQIVIQIIRRIETVHKYSIVYRDIKPENFLLGLPNTPKANIIHVVDFGLAKTYMINGSHILFKEGRSPAGTGRYMSLNVHHGFEQSRRDDMVAIGYVMIYFLVGKKGLPWQGLKDAEGNRILETKQLLTIIEQRKKNIPIAELCKDLPQVFAWYLQDVMKLRFTEKPNYDLYIRKFRDYAKEQRITLNDQYNWQADDSGSQGSDQSGPKACAKTNTNLSTMKIIGSRASKKE